MMRYLLILLVLCLLPAGAADWPQFLGPSRNGMAPDKGIATDWVKRPPKLRWQVALTDDGFAGPAVARGTVFIIDHQGKQDIVRALDLKTGRERWRFAYADADKHVYGFARATPAIAGGKVYTLSRLGKVHCLDAGTGKLCWKRDIAADFTGKVPQWGYSMSPCVDGDALIIADGCLLVRNRKALACLTLK